MSSFLSRVVDKDRVVTAIDGGARFPELLERNYNKYKSHIDLFIELAKSASSSADLLERIRSKVFSADQRMSLLKMFRRCVAPVVDTEMAKKITVVSTRQLVDNYGSTFKSIDLLKTQFLFLSEDRIMALAALVGEYDSRGQLGYELTDRFFSWFESRYEGVFSIEGPRGAGPDVQLDTIFEGFPRGFPCDFVIRDMPSRKVLVIGFARYDSTRGGAQSDDRTGGNSDKVSKAKAYFERTGIDFRMAFLADGPGLLHGDTWEEACRLDDCWDGNVRVTTLKLAEERLTSDWMRKGE